MPQRNPLLASWSIRKFNATVINDIFVEIFFFTGVATMVTAISIYKHNLGINNQLLTVLGTVLGLVVSFRTSSAYDRYWEGRKLWSTILLASRNLGHLIWIHVPNDRRGVPDDPHAKRDARLKAIIEKKSMINLVQAFSVAVKHFLRGEPGIYYEDLYPLVSFLPRYSSIPGNTSSEFKTVDDTLPLWRADNNATLVKTGSLPTSKTTTEDGQKQAGSIGDAEKTVHHTPENPHLLPSELPPKPSVYDYLPFLLPFKFLVSLFMRVVYKTWDDGSGRSFTGKKIAPEVADSNIPLEVSLFLSSYLATLLKQGLLQPAIATAFTNSLTQMQDAVTNLERVRTTPIPFAYQAHLRMTIWLYLIFLPFQIFNALKWITIPATAFTAFLLLGFLEIGQEIENPFQYDENDLDLESFCKSIAQELSEITAHPAPEPSEYLFTVWNQPFAPADPRSAHQILSDMDHDYHDHENGMDSIRRTMLKSWKAVHEETRKKRKRRHV